MPQRTPATARRADPFASSQSFRRVRFINAAGRPHFRGLARDRVRLHPRRSQTSVEVAGAPRRRYGRTKAGYAEEVRMGVLVILEMDGPTDALLTAAADLEARRPTPAILARAVAPTET